MLKSGSNVDGAQPGAVLGLVCADRICSCIDERRAVLLLASLLQLQTLLAEPFAFGPILWREPHAVKVEPLYSTLLIVTGNHFPK